MRTRIYACAHRRGSGHPNFSPADGGRYVVMDAYAKERHWFAGLRDRCVPLRLVDTHTGREVWLAQVRTELPSACDAWPESQTRGSRHLNSATALLYVLYWIGKMISQCCIFFLHTQPERQSDT